MAVKKSLGLVPLPERTVEYDLVFLERFQEFSAELLRLSLIGISAIGFAISKVLFPAKGEDVSLEILKASKPFLAVALCAFGICAAAALAHRYVASDSLSWHLQAMRRYQRGEAGDHEMAQAEYQARYKRFKLSGRLIRVAAISLGAGAIASAVAIWVAL